MNPESQQEIFDPQYVKELMRNVLTINENKMNNSCIVEKKFLLWKYKKVEHDYRLFSISKFMFSSTDFIVKWRCSCCEGKKERHFVTQDELILMGVDVAILNKITGDSSHYFN